MRKIYSFILLALICNAAFAGNPQLTINTNRGDIIVELYPEQAPKTVANFLQYVHSGFYKDTIFHRVINRFMIQGGGFNADLSEKETKPPIINEAANGLLNETGTLAMARTGDPDSATAQFFINLENNQFLNYQSPEPELIGYCVFGRVLKGMEVVREIANTPTGNAGPFSDVPKSTILIQQISLNKQPL